MFVTRQILTPLTDFLWYDGESRLDSTSGYRQFYDANRPSEKNEAVRTDWVYVSDDDRTLTFTNNNTENQGFGDWLRYQVAGEDVSMLFFQATTQDFIEVVWNNASGEGYIIAPNYNNGENACWNAIQEDVACP